MCVCVEHLNRCKTSAFLIAGGAGGTDETGTNKDTHQLPVISMGTLIDVPANFPVSSVMASGQAEKPHYQIVRFHVRLLQSAPLKNLFYWFELQSISEFKAALRMGYFVSGLYSTFHTFILGIPMITSKRTLQDLGLVWLCMHGDSVPNRSCDGSILV